MKLSIGDVTFELEYTVNSVCDLEELMGKGVAEILSVGGFSSVRALLWCGLIEKMPGLTISKAGNLLQDYVKEHSLEELAKILGEAVQHAGFLEEKAVKKAPQKEK